MSAKARQLRSIINRFDELPEPYRSVYKMLRRQGYILVGRHTVVKKCHWVHAALTERRFCYKCKFYGIASHRCIQMSPAALWCWNACLHCWRLRPQDIGVEWDEVNMPFVDDPELIAEGIIEAHRMSVAGYKAHPKVDPRMLEEAMNPKHVAISLTGEPLLYPRLGELIREIHKRGMTTFLVTRGVRPDVLANLEEEPTQLYVSIEAWDKKSYEYFNRPLVPRAWELTLETLEMLPSFSSPTVIRITLVKGFNMHEEALRGFAKLVELAEPTYVEVKAYMWLGASRYRLPKDAMPKHVEVRLFAEKLAELTGYRVLSQQVESRVVLLSRLDKPIRVGEGCPDGWRQRTELDDKVEYELARLQEEGRI